MNYNQTCVWEATLVGKDVKGFEAFIKDELGTRIKYIEEYKTLPTPDKPNTGGRNDVVFKVHDDDIATFTVKRLALGIRWIEDVLDGDEDGIYPERLKEYRTW